MSRAKTYPTIEVLASAVAAYAHNDQIIVRNTIHNDDKRIDSNRQLIADCFEGSKRPFVVNDFHRKEAEGIIKYLQQTIIMQSLKNTPDRFLGQTAELLSNQEVSVKDFGIIAWAPKLADDYQKKDRIREVSARYETHSRYVGHVRDRITTDFTLIEKRYIKSMDCWAVYGVDAGDNLLFYWARSLDKVCEVGKISARIKDHREDEYRGNARVTVLNYVKVL
jgi:hypothetical protein